MPPLPQPDLDQILAATAPLWSQMRNERLFLTGGTGFFGCWLVESFLHANRELALGASLTVLTRSPQSFIARCPHLAQNPALTLLRGDVRTFRFPAHDFRFILHAATEASAKQLAEAPHEMRTTIEDGTQRVLGFARACSAEKLLFTSSGAVYGQQPASISHLPEDFRANDATRSVYGHAKHIAEILCAEAAATTALECKIARCFAFLGPHLPLDTHFAAGNFLRDALAGRDLHIASDGSAVRSYLYAADLATWLWTILFRAPSARAFNVGSEQQIDIRTLAQVTAATVGRGLKVEIAQQRPPGAPVHRYVPSTARARTELGLAQTVTLEEALRRTAAWHRLK